MAPLVVLLISFVSLLIIGKFYKRLNVDENGRIAFAVMLFFTGLSHFAMTKGMVMCIPDLIPAKMMLVYGTGIIEVFFAVGLVTGFKVRALGISLIIFLLSILPANIQSAVQHIYIKAGTYDGPGLSYLWFRIPLQFFFIAWVYYFAVRKQAVTHISNHKML